MYWTLELASKLEDAPWPATKDELIDYAIRSGAPLEVLENLQEIEDEGDVYESIEEIWPDYPSKEDFLFNEDERCENSNYFHTLFLCHFLCQISRLQQRMGKQSTSFISIIIGRADSCPCCPCHHIRAPFLP